MSSFRTIIVALGLMAAGCVNGVGALYVSNAFSIDPDGKGECTLDSEDSTGGGSLDVGAGVRSFFTVLEVGNALTDRETAIGGDILTRKSANIITLDEVEFTYTSQPQLTFAREVQPFAFSIQPATTNNRIGIDVLARNAAEVLTNLNVGDDVLLRVSIRFNGYLAAGGRISSNPFVIPIHVFKTAPPTCTTTLARNGPCGAIGGQDGSTAVCCPAPGGTTMTTIVGCE